MLLLDHLTADLLPVYGVHFSDIVTVRDVSLVEGSTNGFIMSVCLTGLMGSAQAVVVLSAHPRSCGSHRPLSLHVPLQSTVICIDICFILACNAAGSRGEIF